MDGTIEMQHVSNVSQCVIEGVAKQQQQQHAEEEERVKREEMGNLCSRRCLLAFRFEKEIDNRKLI